MKSHKNVLGKIVPINTLQQHQGIVQFHLNNILISLLAASASNLCGRRQNATKTLFLRNEKNQDGTMAAVKQYKIRTINLTHE